MSFSLANSTGHPISFNFGTFAYTPQGPAHMPLKWPFLQSDNVVFVLLSKRNKCPWPFQIRHFVREPCAYHQAISLLWLCFQNVENIYLLLSPEIEGQVECDVLRQNEYWDEGVHFPLYSDLLSTLVPLSCLNCLVLISISL